MVKMLISIIIEKIKSLFNKNAFNAVIIASRIDHTASVRNNVRFYNSQLGKYSYIGRNSLVQNVSIGNFSSISEHCYLGLPSHDLNYFSTSPVFYSGRNVLHKNFAYRHSEKNPRTYIGSDVWIGTGVMVKSGISIGDGVVVGAGAVVTHDVPPYAIVAGVPASIIKYRFDEETIKKLCESKWWEYSDDRLSQYILDNDNYPKIIECSAMNGEE